MIIQVGKQQLLEKLNKLSGESVILTPVVEGQQVKIKKYTGEIYTGNQLPVNSAKEIVLPQRECLLKYSWKKEAGFTGEAVPPDVQKTVVFNRPCDMRAISILDRVFLGEKTDDQYQARRDQLITVALACNSPSQTCFCNLVGGGPFDETGSDLICFVDDDLFTFKSLTDRGESFLKLMGGVPVQEDVFATKKTNAEAKLPGAAVSLTYLKTKTFEKFNDPVWEDLGKRCLGCGACAFLCPTCHCFDIQEEVKGSKGIRVRNWDCCQFSSFTLHASGHNPRSSHTERMRQRFQHKLSYMPENLGMIGCVGCGRCLVYCPVNIDIREIIAKMSSE